MRESILTKRGGISYICFGIGDPGIGAENKLEEEGGKQTLWLDYHEFLVGIYNTIPDWGLRVDSPMAKALRGMLSAIRVEWEPRKILPMEREGYPQIPIVLNADAVIVTMKNWTEVLVPVRSFASKAMDILKERGTIDLHPVGCEFSEKFKERWRENVLWKPREVAAK